MSNVVGEPILEFVDKQIKIRQKAQGAGYNSKSLTRSPEIQNYLNNRNAWIKLASGVELTKTEVKDENGQVTSTYKGTQRLKDLQNFSTDNYFTDNDIASLDGTNLAKNYVLFNTIQSLDTETGTYKKRSGTRQTNSWSTSQNKMYGGMGSNERGLQPTPGIVSIDVDTINRGSIRKATVQLKAYNKFQFGIIEILYLKLGFILMLEYGWDKYITEDSNGKISVKDTGNTIIEKTWFDGKSYSQLEMLQQIQGLQTQYQGNYNGFFGKVNNFSWKLNKDNTYDITINLITLGSVIESLQVSIPSNISVIGAIKNVDRLTNRLNQSAGGTGIFGIEDLADPDDDDVKFDPDSVGSALGTDKITNYLVQSIFEIYDGLSNGSIDTSKFKVLSYLTKDNVPSSSVPFKYKFAVRFGVFLNFLRREIIGYVDNDESSSSRLEIDTTEETNVVNYTLNTVSLDPTICFFTPLIGDIEINGEKTFDAAPLSVNRSKYDAYNGFDNMKKFAVKSSVNEILYGQLMNVYLNFQFISDCIKGNLDKENKLDLYKFLESICDGINKSMGNSTRIAPAIKNDSTIYFIDENPITGWEEHSGVSNKKSTQINLFGYNPDGSSNFVKDFGFQTKLDPKLINSISIGATAGGYNNATDAIGFRQWNRGLKNRFENSYRVDENTKEKSKSKKDQLWERAKRDLVEVTPIGSFGYKLTYLEATKKWTRGTDVNGDQVRRRFTKEKNFESTDLKNKVVEWMIDVENYRANEAATTIDKDSQNIINYNIWVATTLGWYKGDTNSSNFTDLDYGVALKDAPYFTCDSEIASAGANTYKAFINSFNKLLFESFGINTGYTGFIPVDLSFTCDGLSGFKIYNKLDVNQRELPASYPSALKFLITGIKDKVSSNNWETEINTISQPSTIESPKAIYKISTDQAGSDAGQGGDGEFYEGEGNTETLIKKFNIRTTNTSNGLIYWPQVTQKNQVVIHHTAGDNSIKSVINSWRNKSTHVSTHYIINRDGDYDQLFPLKYWGNSIGIGSGSPGAGNNRTLQKSHISIELQSLGYFKRLKKVEGAGYLFERKGKRGTTSRNYKNIKPMVVSPNEWVPSNNFRTEQGTSTNYFLIGTEWKVENPTPTTKVTKVEFPVVNEYKGYKYFQAYTEDQLKTLVNVLKEISEQYPNIPIFVAKNNIYKNLTAVHNQWSNMFPPRGRVSPSAINKTPGLYTHNSYRADKVDVVPQWDLFRALYFSDTNKFGSSPKWYYKYDNSYLISSTYSYKDGYVNYNLPESYSKWTPGMKKDPTHPVNKSRGGR